MGGFWVSSVAVSGNGNAVGAIADAVYFFGSPDPDASINVSVTINPVTDHSTDNQSHELPTTHPAPLLPVVSIAAAGLGIIIIQRSRKS